MAIFSKKIVTAKFIDSPNNMTIEVLYREGDAVIPYILEVDFTNQEFNDLLQEVTLEKIEKNTQELRKTEREALERIINDAIEKRWQLESEKVKKAYDDVDKYAEKLYKDVDKYAEKLYKDVDKYAEKSYGDLDKYAEQQKRIKFEEVQQEYTELRKQLQEKFSTDQSKTTIDNINGKDLLDLIHAKNEDQDFVFNTKIAILEDPMIAKSKDKNLKLSIRKTKSLKELLSIYFSTKVE